MASNVLDLEPQKIQKLSGGVQAPTVKVAKTDISNSVNNLTNTIMEIGGSIIQNNKRKEIAERKDLRKQEEQNMLNYNKIFKIQSKEMTNANYAEMSSKKENYYDTPSAFYNAMDSARDTSYKAISDNKGLTELSKAELQADLDKQDRVLRESFRLGVNKFNTQRNKDQVEETANTLGSAVTNYMYEGNVESAQNSMVQLGETYKLGIEIGAFTPEEVTQNLGVVMSGYLEGLVVGSIEKFKGEHDLNTTEGINDFNEKVVAYGKNFDAKGIRSFFKDAFKDLPFEQKDVGASVHKMIKQQVEQQIWMASNKKVGIEKRTLKEKEQLKLNPHKVLQDDGIIYSSENANKGGTARIVGAMVDKTFGSDLEAEKHVIDNNLTYSTYSPEGMAVLKKSIDSKLKVNDVDGLFKEIEKQYEFKVLNEDGLVESLLVEEMFGKDLVEATSGLIDSNYLKAYTDNDVPTQETYKTSLRFGKKNVLIGEGQGKLTLNDLTDTSLLSAIIHPIDTVTGLFDDRPFKEMNDKITFMNLNGLDIEESDRLKGLVDNYAYSYFYESILADEDEINEFNSSDKKGKKEMIGDFYEKKENMEKLNEASKTLSSNYLGGNIVNVTSGQMPSKILVSDKYKELDYNSIKNNLIEHGTLVYEDPNTGESKRISSEKLRANLIIESVGVDKIGYFYKDKNHQLKFEEFGKLRNAETNLKDFTTIREKTLEQGGNQLIKKGTKITEFEDFAKGRNIVASLGRAGTITRELTEEFVDQEGRGDKLTTVKTGNLGMTENTKRKLEKKHGKKLTDEEAVVIFLDDLGNKVDKVNPNLDRGMKKAIIDSLYNIGEGALKWSSFKTFLKNPTEDNLKKAILTKIYAGGKSVKGIGKRRAEAYNKSEPSNPIKTVTQEKDGDIIYKDTNGNVVFKVNSSKPRHRSSKAGTITL